MFDWDNGKSAKDGKYYEDANKTVLGRRTHCMMYVFFFLVIYFKKMMYVGFTMVIYYYYL